MPSRKLPILPQKSHEAVQNNLNPYLTSIGKAENDTIFSQNRGNDLSAKNTGEKDFSIGLKDIDGAIKYYFENIIKPSVILNEQKISVPIIYGNQELWKSIQSDGYYRDANGKIMAPLITFKRQSIDPNRNLTNKLDGNKVHLYQVFEKKYTKQNYYDNFSVLNNRKPVRQFITTVVPDYVDITYNCIIFTEYIEQINPIIESINFSANSYWGDFNRFKFRSNINSFGDTVELNVGEERIVRSDFSIKLFGYLIPDSINKQIASIDGFFSKAQVVFNMETTSDDLETVVVSEPKTNVGATNLIDSYNTNITSTTIVNLSGDSSVLSYLNTNRELIGTYVSENTITFNKGWLEAPLPLPSTSIDNFLFFNNGQNIEKSAIVSFTQNSGISTLVVDTNILGYSFEVDDIIIAIGKFTS